MYAFLGCESLKAITIPTSVTEIGTYALGYLSKSGRPIEGFTIYGASGSAAQSYAEENGFQFVAVEPPYVSGDVNEDGEINISRSSAGAPQSVRESRIDIITGTCCGRREGWRS